MDLIITILLTLIVVSILVFVHEFGHFVAAKKSGVRVDEFGFGFPPRLWGKKVGETIYSINLLPFGGFVKVFGEDSEGQNDPRSFTRKPLYIKLSILLAGVIMNLILAYFILSFIQIIGAPTDIDDSFTAANTKIFIGEVVKNSPADNAGFTALDTIKEIRTSEAVYYPNKILETQTTINTNSGKELIFIVERGKELKELKVIPQFDSEANRALIGIQLLRVANVSYPWYEAPWRGFWLTLGTVISTLGGIIYIFKELFNAHTLNEGVSGPVGIASLIGQMRVLGLSHLLHFIAVISINLAIINALPIPALDGGRAFILLVEKLRRRAFSEQAMRFANAFVFALLITFIIFISIRDVQKLM